MATLSAETERLIVERAAAAGKTPDMFVREIIGGGQSGMRGRAIDMARIDEITRRHAARPVLDPRPLGEIVDEVNDFS